MKLAQPIWLAVLLMSLSGQAAAQAPVPPPAEQLTADCMRPVFASDQLICADPELLQMDSQLARTLLQSATLKSASFVEDDPQWFKRRSRCAFEVDHRNCLVAAYRDRLAVIQTAGLTPVLIRSARCASYGRVTLGTSSLGPMVVRSARTDAVIAVASPPAAPLPWKPALSYIERGRVIDFESQDGRTFSCRLDR